MIDLSKKTALVVDHGAFVEFALRLARKPDGFGTVLYHCPHEYGYSHVSDVMVGSGFKRFGVDWVDDPFDPEVLSKVDIACFPDVQHSGAQLLLEKFGIPVWGSRRGDSIELLRRKFREFLEAAGLPVPEYSRIIGYSNLLDYLKDHPGVFVKISRFRGSMETRQFLNMPLSRNWLDQLAVELSAVREKFPFIVENPIENADEIGLDTFSIDGKFPNTCVEGMELKDRAYIGRVCSMDEISESLQRVSQSLSPLLKDFRYRNWISAELRITEDGTANFIDPCQRLASPGGESMLELYSNVPQFVFEGAHGRLIEPVPVKRFSAQCWIEHKDSQKLYRAVQIPDEIRDFVKLRFACYVDGAYQVVPQPEPILAPPDPHVGFVCGIGITPMEARNHLLDVAQALKGQNIIVHTESIDECLDQWQEYQDQDSQELQVEGNHSTSEK